MISIILLRYLLLPYAIKKASEGMNEKYHFKVTSWFRDVKKNKSVGGVPDSDHIYAMAVDVVIYTQGNLDNGINHENNVKVRSILGKFGYRMVTEISHLHIGYSRVIEYCFLGIVAISIFSRFIKTKKTF